jgi:hypothetical protein
MGEGTVSVHTMPVEHRSAWFGRDLIDDPSWLVHLSEQDLAEVAVAVHQVRARGLVLGEVGRSNFPLPTLAAKLAKWLEEIRAGRGFVLVRGLNITDYTDEEVGLIFWAIGSHLGIPVTQNPRGDLLGHVYDHGRRYGDIDVRGYETNAHLPFHTDSCDVVGLLCLRRAKRGGLSSIVSAITLHNEILRQHPEYLPPLYRGFYYIKRETALTDDPVTAHRLPVFGAKDGYISARLVRNQINAACVKKENRSNHCNRRRWISSTAWPTTPIFTSTWICNLETCSSVTTTRSSIRGLPSRTGRSRNGGAI